MDLTTEQHDALTELVNIGVGRAAAALSELCGERVNVSVPRVLVCQLAELADHLPVDEGQLDTLVFEDFQGRLSGRAVLAFPHASSLRLGQLLGHIACLPSESDVDLCGILTEVGNLVLNGVLGSMGNMAQTRLLCSVPELVTITEPTSLLAGYLSRKDQPEHSLFLANVHFHVARRDIQGSILVLFECDGIVSLLDSLIVQSI
ncbi:MAG: chemotaxis protein CheC [Thermoguttaceae bacterium]|jgi:chemotaxis protein CheC